MTTKHERAAMSRLIDTFGAEVLVNLIPPPTRKPVQIAKDRSRVCGAIDDCKACGLYDLRQDLDRIGPEFATLSGTVDLTILTEFPVDPHGRYGRQLRRALQAADIDMQRVAWCSMVNCIPRHPDGALRAASKIERQECAIHLFDSLAAAGAPNVLIIGDKAMKAWRSDLTGKQVAGVIGTWRNRYMVTVVPHPAAMTGAGELRQWTLGVEKAVRLLMQEAVGGIGERCMEPGCQRPFGAWDQDALPWCLEHLEVRDQPRIPEFVNERLPL